MEVNKQETEPKSSGKSAGSSTTKSPKIGIPDTLSVKQLADLLNVSAIDVIKQLMRNGIMANINQAVDYGAASAVASSLGIETTHQAQTKRKSTSVISEIKKQQIKGSSGLISRPPVVVVMGHVDHGKTRLLDAIRKTNVMDSEAGGITQHIGAYQVEIDGQKITFLDTPGHEAFTAMRARGAQVTDITILVVAADDGVMPQTLEAIDHAKAAGIPIVVAINKIDKPEANLDHVKQQLAEADLLIEEWGGDVIAIPISAKENTGIQELLENLLLIAEMEELKADPTKPGVGVIIEAELDKTRGAVTTVLVHDGTLRVGDIVVVGNTWGKVKAMFNDVGKQVRKAGPAIPVEILGLSTVSQAGESLIVVPSEKQAKEMVSKRLEAERRDASASQAVSLSNLFDQVSTGQVKELAVILKTDVQGSIEPIKESLERLSTDTLKVRVIHSGSGNVTESDVMLAVASKGIIIGFNTSSEPGSQRMAEMEGINIRYYDIIYNLQEDVSKALMGMLEPTKVEVISGRAEVRAVFSSGKKDKIAGVYVTEGQIRRSDSVRIQRNGETIHETMVASLRRFKDDVREVATGYECGIGLRDYEDFEVGDILEFFRIEEVR
ncbi:MAG: translation initiation factor IF-2 [Chloroflexi bacterium RBG_13_46_14]|nr:MAG: translation initiation factor IF-2 [Chloroflexi bacterium RBG_13_46_14]